LCLALLYRLLPNNNQRTKVFALISFCFLVLGYVILQFVTDSPMLTLANATLKAPPHIAYFLIYCGLAMFFTGVVAIASTNKLMPKFIFLSLDIIGRNSLLAYVLHYFLFIATPISMFIFGYKSSFNELITFIAILFVFFGGIWSRDKVKENKKISSTLNKAITK